MELYLNVGMKTAFGGRVGYRSTNPPLPWSEVILRDSQESSPELNKSTELALMHLCDDCPYSDCHPRLKGCPVNMAGFVTPGGIFRKTKGQVVKDISPDEFSPEAYVEHMALKTKRDEFVKESLANGVRATDQWEYKNLTGKMYRMRLKEGRKRAQRLP